MNANFVFASLNVSEVECAVGLGCGRALQLVDVYLCILYGGDAVGHRAFEVSSCHHREFHISDIENKSVGSLRVAVETDVVVAIVGN